MREPNRPEQGEHGGAGDRLTWAELGRELREQLVGDERGVVYTFKAAWRRPADLARGHVERREPGAVRPLRYLIGATAIYSAASWWWLDGAPWPRVQELGPVAMAQAEFIIRNAGFFLAALIPLMAGLIHLAAARRVPMLTALVLVAYAQAQVMLVQSLVVTPLALFFSAGIAAGVALFLAVYLVASFAALLPGRRWWAWLRALALVMLVQIANNLLAAVAIRAFGIGTASA